jgi:glutathione S-transferase
VENEFVTSDKSTLPTLYGVSLSPFVRKVRVALALKSIDYELVAVMPGAMTPEFHAKSPLSKVPVFEEDGFALPDSSVICAYLERTRPTPALYPTDPRAFGLALFWEEYADTRLVDSAGPPFFERVVHAKIFKQPVDEEIVRRHVEEVLPPVQDQLETLFVASGIANPAAMTIADISVWSSFVTLAHADIGLDPDRWPGLVNFLSEMNANPILGGLVEEERVSLAPL